MKYPSLTRWDDSFIKIRTREMNDAAFYFREHVKPETQICKHFGCGKTLLSQEILCGGYCIHHQHKTISPHIDKLISM